MPKPLSGLSVDFRPWAIMLPVLLPHTLRANIRNLCEIPIAKKTDKTTLSLVSPEVKRLYRIAERHFFTKKYRLALYVFQKIINTKPESRLLLYPRFHELLGDTYLLLDQPDQALASYEIALKLYTSTDTIQIAKTYFRLGQIYLRKQWKKPKPFAIPCFEKAFTLSNGQLAQSLYYLALAYLYLDRNRDHAIFYLKEYLKRIDPNKDPQYKKIEKVIQILQKPSCDLKKLPPTMPIKPFLKAGCEKVAVKETVSPFPQPSLDSLPVIESKEKTVIDPVKESESIEVEPIKIK